MKERASTRTWVVFSKNFQSGKFCSELLYSLQDAVAKRLPQGPSLLRVKVRPPSPTPWAHRVSKTRDQLAGEELRAENQPLEQ
ncbi:hypothetical protein PoB_006191200 [Plakobranchus ocellatus]|uniref:Uncharacterized protein n=1 Tax=Plakobranchus ocellatus TaxID=259542 RepID=A0AAV4CU38_9GAST|nr:hypothetical protein PoB_006191200 [Plakobranchus ocellatus]